MATTKCLNDKNSFDWSNKKRDIILPNMIQDQRLTFNNDIEGAW